MKKMLITKSVSLTRFLISLSAFIASIIFLSVATTTLANAQTEPSPAAVEAQRQDDLEAIRPLAESEGLSPEELQARENILIKTKMSLPQFFMEKIQADPAYADTWVQHQPKPITIITFAGNQGYQRGKALVDAFAKEFGGFWVGYVEVRKANISQIELNKLRVKTEGVLRSNGIDFRSGIGHDDNSPDAYISIEVMKPVKTVEELLLKANIKLSPFIKIEQVSEFAEPFSSLYGGHSLFNPTRALFDCTV
jgi:hypothetical protein